MDSELNVDAHAPLSRAAESENCSSFLASHSPPNSEHYGCKLTFSELLWALSSDKYHQSSVRSIDPSPSTSFSKRIDLISSIARYNLFNSLDLLYS